MTSSQPLSQACDAADARRRQAWRILLASLVVIGLGLVPLIATRALYLDDMSRALDGYYGWMLNARPAAEGIMRLLGFGDVLVNVAPLPQLAAWGLAAGMALAWWRWLPGLSLAGCVVGNALIWLTPFTLQNFSYTFDSLPMSVALASAILASLVLRAGGKSREEGEQAGGISEGPWQAWQPPLSALLLLLLALCCYQPALNAFLVLSLLEALFAGAASTSLWSRWRMLLQRGALAAVALLLYLPITRLLVAGEYSQQHGQMLPFADPQALLAGLEHNLSVALGALREGLGQVTLLLSLALLAGVALLRLLSHGALVRQEAATGAPEGRSRSARQLSLQRMSWALWALLLVPALWGPMLLLAEPVFHSRTLIAWGPLLGGALMLALSVRARESVRSSAEASATPSMTESANTQRKTSVWRRLAQCPLMQCLLIVAGLLLVRHEVIFAAWSNALAAQQAHETQLARTLVAQAREQGLPLDSPRDAERYQPRDALPVLVLGEAPVAPLARVARQQVAAVGQNLVAAFTPDNYWAVVRLRLAGASAVTLLRDEALKARLQARSPCAPGDAASQASDQPTRQPTGKSSAPSSVQSQVLPQARSQVPSPALSLQEGVWVIDFRKPRQCD
ncbi:MULTISPECIES: glucosyltransferase domain-containing protein [unclassified Cobetia]|uniref:glucosyltransferase domain-containing protein n=1 Tax=unclassified Cobetia TaxID=2609414 RepID=UPI00178CF5BC|nr:MULTISPECIES: glucosyltransferase domain-containing protein [unclassified Cobetia]MBE2167633.1 glucosyltransferase domain-containing protein [Cobetia sp. 2AS1]MDH2446056.1 glucosyltransferase domain-containing protein [Cobetia sp. 2AS]